MDRDPRKPYRWIDRIDFNHVPPIAGDTFFPEIHPHIPNNHSEEEEPEEEEYHPASEGEPEEEEPEEEDPEEEDPEEEEPEEYHPASDEEEEYHPRSANEDDEDEDMGECYTPPSSQRIRPVLKKKTARMNVHPNDNFGTFHFEGMPSNPLPHFETGESSQAPPRNIPIPPPAAPTIDQFNELVEQIRWLKEREISNSEAIQTLYHRMGASRTEANNLRAHNQVLSYRLEITETRLDAAEHRAQEAEQERDLIRDEHDEIVRRFNDM